MSRWRVWWPILVPWLLTLVANCFLVAGLAFLAYMALTELRRSRRAQDQRDVAYQVRDGVGAKGRKAVRSGPG